jgi:hypothetical protein
VLVEGGHYALARGSGGEVIDVPGVGAASALTTDTTRETFARAADLVRTLRARGVGAELGLMVGDLALPSGARPAGGVWALPPSYRALLGDLPAPRVWGEAYARNQGKRRLLDEADPDAEATYTAQGWALLRDGEHLLLASDASLEWEGDVRAAVLGRGRSPLCPLVFAGLKRAIFQAGFQSHVAVYAAADDAWIDAKLRAAAAAFAQLYRGVSGPQVDLIRYDGDPRVRRWDPAELRAPGELAWAEFLAEVRRHHPGAHPLEAPCPTTSSPSIPACLPAGTNSRSCG